MGLVRSEPSSLANLVWRDFDRHAKQLRHHSDVTAAQGAWLPAVDVIEDKDRFLLRADVPGVDRADIDVSLEDGVLTIAGRRRAEDRDEGQDVWRAERLTGRFVRRFTLPESIDPTGATARCAEGILELVIPKAPDVQPRRITVEAA